MPKDLTKNTLVKGLNLIEIVAGIGGSDGATLNSIAEASGENKSNVYRYLMTLCEIDWLERDDETHRYMIGPKLLQAAVTSVPQFDLRLRAKKILNNLALELHHTVHLAALQAPFIIYLDKFENHLHPSMRSRPGISAYCHCTAMGKAMLATMSDQEIRRILPESLESRTTNTISSLDDLLQNLKEVRRRGFAADLEENEEGISCVGSPIFGFDHKMIGAISITCESEIFTPDSIEIYGKRVVEVANQVSERMGCRINT